MNIPRDFLCKGKYFSFINTQGKLVIYDTETGSIHQVYTPNLHLNVPCTCFTWIETGQKAGSAKKKKKRHSIVEAQNFIALGTSKGGIALYNLATAQIEKSFAGAGHSGSVTAIRAKLETDTIYTAGSDGKVIEWSISEGNQKKVHNLGPSILSCLAVIQEVNWILSGATELKLWDLENEKLLKTLTGHTTRTLLCLIIVNDEKIYSLTGSANDRNVSLWQLDGREKTAVGLFTMDDAPVYFSAEMILSKLHLVTVSRTGVAHYYIKNIEKINNKPIKASYTFEVAIDSKGNNSKSVDRLPIFTARVLHSADQEQLLIAYGTEHNLKFEQITIDKLVKHNIIVRENVSSLQNKDAVDNNLKLKTPTVESAQFSNPVNVGKKPKKTIEIPMEERLENLALAVDDKSNAKSGKKDMAHLLIQGLHSKDAAILRTVFSKDDPSMIQHTLEKLPAQYVSALLTELSSLMDMRTVHVATAVCWIKILIHTHSSQLMALGSDNLLSNFATCLGIIDYRIEHSRALSKLNARLELLVKQIDRAEKLTNNLDEGSDVLIHQEEDSDVDSVIGKEHGSIVSSEDESSEMIDDENSDENTAVENGGSFVRLRKSTSKKNRRDALDNSDEMEVSCIYAICISSIFGIFEFLYT